MCVHAVKEIEKAIPGSSPPKIAKNIKRGFFKKPPFQSAFIRPSSTPTFNTFVLHLEEALKPPARIQVVEELGFVLGGHEAAVLPEAGPGQAAQRVRVHTVLGVQEDGPTRLVRAHRPVEGPPHHQHLAASTTNVDVITRADFCRR